MDRDQYRPSPTALKLKAVTGFLLGGLGALVESVLEPWKLNIEEKIPEVVAQSYSTRPW